MFTPADHDLVGRTMTYLPDGTSPYDPALLAHEGVPIINSGDPVTVLSAWSRDYLPNGGKPLLYVESHNTRDRTHVTPDQLKDII